MNLLSSLLVPILLSPIIYFLGGKLKRNVGWIATASLLYTLIVIAWESVIVLNGGKPFELYKWTALFQFGLLMDGVSTPAALIISMLGFLTCIYSVSYVEHKHGHGAYFALYVLYIAGMLGVVLSTNLIQFYFFWELMLVPSYFLLAEWGYGNSRRIAFKYFIFTHVGALSLLLGILTLYTYTNTFNLLELSETASTLSRSVQILVLSLMFIGFAVKMALFPVHTWLPDAHAEAPTPISVLLSGVMIETGAYAVVRMIISVFGSTWTQMLYLIAAMALISMIYGGAMALVQDDIKRLLAYSSISQMGYIGFGLSMATYYGLTGSILHIVNHGICKGLLFMTAGAVMHQTGLRDMNKLNGLGPKMPVTATVALIGALGIAGAPPTNGFQSEWMIFEGGMQAQQLLLTIIAVVSTALTAGYMLWMIRKVYFGPLPEYLMDAKEAPMTMLVPMAILAVLAVVIGIYPTPLLKIIQPGVQGIIGFIGGMS